jgi:hypothetical protein
MTMDKETYDALKCVFVAALHQVRNDDDPLAESVKKVGAWMADVERASKIHWASHSQ